MTTLKSSSVKSDICLLSQVISVACFLGYMGNTFLFLCTSHNFLWKTGNVRSHIVSTLGQIILVKSIILPPSPHSVKHLTQLFRGCSFQQGVQFLVSPRSPCNDMALVCLFVSFPDHTQLSRFNNFLLIALLF